MIKAKIDKLSETRRAVLFFIIEYLGENSYPPSIREIQDEVGISSTSVVSYNLDKLAEVGLIERESTVSRGIRLSEELKAYIRQTEPRADDLVHVPLWGTIVAGEPVSVPTETPTDEVIVTRDMIGSARIEDVFALRVRGDSMIDASVNDGDIVILRRQQEARNGEMVAAWIPAREETTLKYFHNEGERIRLQPANPMMDPIYLHPSEVQVQGRVLSVLRRM
jgi:repressor LexA